MAGINSLREIYDKKGKDFLDRLLNNYVIINERIDGSFFGVKKSDSDKFKYFKKSGEISYVDRVLMKYYNPVISYFNSMAAEKRQRIPANFYFGFEYFTSGDAKESGLKQTPKNNLILAYIHRLDKEGKVVKTVQNKEQLDRWADYLEVERPPIIFEGHLSDEQKSDILDFAYSESDELEQRFKTTSFTQYLLSILDSEQPSDLVRDIETVIFRFYDAASPNPEEKVFLAKLMDPVFQQKISENKPKENRSQDYIWLIIIDLMNFIELYSLDDLTSAASDGSNFEEKHLNLVNKIFKDFIVEYSKKYDGLILEVPEYLQRPEFELDQSLITDPKVKSLISGNDTYSEIYKILLNFFRRPRKKSSAGFFTPELLTQLNLVIKKLKNIIMGDAVYEGLFPSFSEFIGSNSDTGVLGEKESLKTRNKKHKVIDVNILIGRFQPVSVGHIKAIQKLKESNGNKCLIIAIKDKEPSRISPFSLKQTQNMLNKVAVEYKADIEGIRVIPSGQLKEAIAVIQPDYRPVLWGTSESRIKDYALQLDYIKKKNIPLRFMNDFKLIELPKYVTSAEILKTLEDSDFKEFKKKVPKSIASEFYNLKNELSRTTPINESVSIKPVTFDGLIATGDIVKPETEEEN